MSKPTRVSVLLAHDLPVLPENRYTDLTGRHGMCLSCGCRTARHNYDGCMTEGCGCKKGCRGC